MIDVSYLQNIYTKKTGERCLHRSHITGFGTYPDFATFIPAFLEASTLLQPATSKNDAYGWCATLFDPTGEEGEVNAQNARYGGHNRYVLAHRAGSRADDHLTLFFADLDNHIEDQPRVTIDDVETSLRALGLPFILYTSFSHKPDRHKVRIIIPVDRPMTIMEAFEVFKSFNYSMNFQLDGSVYDPGDFLYGPPLGSDIRTSLAGQPLDVDAWIARSATLPAEARDFVSHAETTKQKSVTTSPEQKAHARALFESIEVSEDISISNPKYFNPAWFDDADSLYRGGSHWATMIGLLTKVWIKSKQNLTYADMGIIYDGLDSYWCGYLRTTYDSSERKRAIKDVMKTVGSSLPFIPTQPTDRELHAAMSRMKRKTRKSK